MVYGVIYLITCLVTGKLYVGQTTQKLAERISQHKCGDIYVDRVIKKYGWSDDTFKVEVLEECYSREQLDERERYWIAKLNCKYPNDYNMTDGGEGCSGKEISQEVHANMSKNQCS